MATPQVTYSSIFVSFISSHCSCIQHCFSILSRALRDTPQSQVLVRFIRFVSFVKQAATRWPRHKVRYSLIFCFICFISFTLIAVAFSIVSPFYRVHYAPRHKASQVLVRFIRFVSVAKFRLISNFVSDFIATDFIPFPLASCRGAQVSRCHWSLSLHVLTSLLFRSAPER